MMAGAVPVADALKGACMRTQLGTTLSHFFVCGHFTASTTPWIAHFRTDQYSRTAT
jgi:hypothetical protein